MNAASAVADALAPPRYHCPSGERPMPATDQTRDNLLRLALNGVEQLDQLPTEADRHRAMEAIGAEISGWSLIAGVGSAIGGAIGVAWLANLAIRLLWPGAPAGVAELAAYSTGGLVFVLTLRWVCRRRSPLTIRQRLIDAGMPVC